jgi:hypothetical protein
MKNIRTNTYYEVNLLPVRRFSSIAPNAQFIDYAKLQTKYTINRRRRFEMINEMIAFHYVLNLYHVNSISGDEDINRYRELPHVLLGHGSTYRVHPYWGHEGLCDIFWDNLVWSKLYDDGINTASINPPLIDSNQSNRIINMFYYSLGGH